MNDTMKKYLSVPEAAKEASREGIEVTEVTIINWCRRYGIGIKVGGRWAIIPDLLQKVLRGEAEGMEVG